MLLLSLVLLVGCDDLKVDYGDDGTSVDGGAVTDDTGISSDGGGASDGGTTDGGTSDGGSTDGGAESSAGWAWGTLDLADADASYVGDSDELYGLLHLADVGDMTGDGIDELVFSDAIADTVIENGGLVYLVPGRRSGWSVGASLDDVASIYGATEKEQVAELRPLGDIDGDGLADLALTNDERYGGQRVRSYVLFGGADGWSGSTPVDDVDVVIEASSSHVLLTDAYADVGDLTGDGTADLLLRTLTDEGLWTYVYRGAELDGAVELPSGATQEYDCSGSIWIPIDTGDVDGDAVSEIIFQETVGTERVSLHLVDPGELTSEFVVREDGVAIIPSVEHGEVDATVLEDLNGDGAAEILVYEQSGKDVRQAICMGRSSWTALASIEECELQVPEGDARVAGDLDGDGRPELVREDVDTGLQRVELYLGRESWSGDLAEIAADTLFLPSSGEPTIGAVADPEQRGDIDGDGLDDLVLRDSERDRGGETAVGRVVVFLGREHWASQLDADEAELRVEGLGAYDVVGDEMITSDLNGDGRQDLVFLTARSATETGEVSIFFGQPFPE